MPTWKAVASALVAFAAFCAFWIGAYLLWRALCGQP